MGVLRDVPLWPGRREVLWGVVAALGRQRFGRGRFASNDDTHLPGVLRHAVGLAFLETITCAQSSPGP